MSHDQFPSNPKRRAFLKSAAVVSGSSAIGGYLLTQPQDANATEVLNQAVRVVIVGSGLGGQAAAHRLRKQLPNAKITLIDAKKEHIYQPGLTLLGTGIWNDPNGVSLGDNARLTPAGVVLIPEAVAEFKPESNQVITSSGQAVAYDFMIVASGTHQKWDEIEGMDVNAIGQNGLASVYPGKDAAANTWKALETFAQKGGRAINTLPKTFLKCAGAPLKITFMVEDRLKRVGSLGNSKIEFFSALPKTIFSVKSVNDNVIERWNKLENPVPVSYNRNLVGIDIGARKAHFKNETDQIIVEDYDFIHIAPPQSAILPVVNSALAVQEDGPQKGWLNVNKDTLQHKVFPNVFGLGDTNGTPRGKTAATVKKSTPIVVHNLLQVIQGKPADQKFDGYTSCPLLIREGSAMLIEFDYDGNLIPSLPLIEPLKDSYLAWLLKYALLKPAYVATLKGHV